MQQYDASYNENSMKKHPEDSELVDSFAQGGKLAEESFRLLTLKYGPPLYRYIRSLTRNHEDANDVLQNALIKVYQNLKAYRGDSALYTWLYRIARNESLNFIKSRQRRSTVDLDEPLLELHAGHVLLDSCNEDQLSDLFQKALDQLPEKQALVFQLKYFEDLKYSEIAERLGMSEGGLKANFHHARQKIETFITSELNQINNPLSE